VIGAKCIDSSGDIKDTAEGKGHYTGTENTWSSLSPCTGAGTATNTIQISSDGETAQWDSAGCSNCGPQTWTRVDVSTGPTAVSSPLGCTRQDPSTCLLASNAVAGLDVGRIQRAPARLTMKTSEVNRDGFAGAEFTDGQGDIIIADEDADLASPFGAATPYQSSSFLAEVQIYAGLHPTALSSAVQFGAQVAASNSSAKIYVTGFGLGGVEAEAQAQALGSRVSGGVTFGAPGLPGSEAGVGQSTVTNFVDYGDPVGNWASDPQSELTELAGKSADHFGDAELTGSPGNAAQIKLALAAHGLETPAIIDKVLDALPVTPSVKKILNLTKVAERAEVVVDAWDASAKFVSCSYLAYAALDYHSLGQYASDLGVSLTSTVASPVEAADFREFDPAASTATLQAAAATTVSSGGAVSGPGDDATASTATGELDTQTFADQVGSQYDVTYDASEQISSLAVNDPGGTSYVISNDDVGQQAWSSRVYYYSGPDETGTLTGVLYNWHAGGSQLQLFVGLPRGVSEETLNYSQPDAAGTLTSKNSN
jgi:hypothetical protein